MRRPNWYRFLAAAVGTWLTIALLGADRIVACTAHASASHDDSAEAASLGLRPANAGHPCACLGECTAVSLAGLPVRAAAVVAAVVVEVDPSREAPAADVVAAPRPHVHPFANGPPARV